MARNIKLSIIILTHNNYELKNGCVETVLLSVVNQVNAIFEIILVDNNSNSYNRLLLKKFVDDLTRKVKKNIRINYIFNDYNNIARGRNIGAKYAKNDVLVFLDDDIFFVKRDVLFQLVKAYRLKSYGYAALRKWTKPEWYLNSKTDYNKKLEEFGCCEDVTYEDPNPEVRKKKDNRHLMRTYIGNFGYVDRKLFKKIGGWCEEFCGYGFEDDFMAFKLYIEEGSPFLLDNIEVVHVWHTIGKEDYVNLSNNKLVYNEKLRQYGIKVFHTGRLLYNEDDVIEYY